MNTLNSSNGAETSKVNSREHSGKYSTENGRDHENLRLIYEKMGTLKGTLSKCRREHAVYLAIASGIVALGAVLALFKFTKSNSGER